MPKVEFTQTVSYGNLLTAVAMIAAGVSAYAVTATTVDGQSKQIARLEKRVDTLEDADRRLELTIAQTLTEMRADVRFLRQTVEELAGQRP